jgi:hypothetical protein
MGETLEVQVKFKDSTPLYTVICADRTGELNHVKIRTTLEALEMSLDKETVIVIKNPIFSHFDDGYKGVHIVDQHMENVTIRDYDE